MRRSMKRPHASSRLLPAGADRKRRLRDLLDL
jgi:hypothetical protein